MEADIIGLNKILDCIKGSSFTKLAVYRYPQNSGNIPVFEKLNAKSNHELVKDFNDWGKNIDNSVIYEINLFDNVLVSFDENGQEKLKRDNAKNGKAKFYIQFKKDSNNNSYSNGSNNTDMATIVGLVSENLRKSQEDNLILKELAELKNKITIMEEDEDEEEETGLAGLKPENIGQFISALQMLSGNVSKPTTSVINGVMEEKKENIKKAIGILYKYDPDLDQDLLKLSSLAENNNATFKMLLTTLRNM
jgi:hypothetical protein